VEGKSVEADNFREREYSATPFIAGKYEICYQTLDLVHRLRVTTLITITTYLLCPRYGDCIYAGYFVTFNSHIFVSLYHVARLNWWRFWCVCCE